MMPGHKMAEKAPESSSCEETKSSIPGWSLYFTYFTAFWVGATILSLEIIGSRILAPFFGTGLYVWSSLLAAPKRILCPPSPVRPSLL